MNTQDDIIDRTQSQQISNERLIPPGLECKLGFRAPMARIPSPPPALSFVPSYLNFTARRDLKDYGRLLGPVRARIAWVGEPPFDSLSVLFKDDLVPVKAHTFQ